MSSPKLQLLPSPTSTPIPQSTTLSPFISGLPGLSPTNVSGIVRLSYPEDSPVRAKRLHLVLTAKSQTSWFRQPQPLAQAPTSSVSASSAAKPFHYHAEDILLMKSLELWCASSPDGWEPLASLDFPFELSLPSDLSDTLDPAPHGSLTLTLSVTLTRRSKLPLAGSFETTKTISIPLALPRYILSTRPEYNIPVHFSPDPRYSASRGIHYDISVPRSAFGPLDRIEAHIHLQVRDPHLHLLRVEMGIKEYAEYRAGSGHAKCTKAYVAHMDLVNPATSPLPPNAGSRVAASWGLPGGPGAGGFQFWQTITLERPAKARPSADTRLISIRHDLKLRLCIEGEKDIRLECPVIFTGIGREECERVHQWLANQFTPTLPDHEPPPPSRERIRARTAGGRPISMMSPASAAPHSKKQRPLTQYDVGDGSILGRSRASSGKISYTESSGGMDPLQIEPDHVVLSDPMGTPSRVESVLVSDPPGSSAASIVSRLAQDPVSSHGGIISQMNSGSIADDPEDSFNSQEGVPEDVVNVTPEVKVKVTGKGKGKGKVKPVESMEAEVIEIKPKVRSIKVIEDVPETKPEISSTSSTAPQPTPSPPPPLIPEPTSTPFAIPFPTRPSTAASSDDSTPASAEETIPKIDTPPSPPPIDEDEEALKNKILQVAESTVRIRAKRDDVHELSVGRRRGVRMGAVSSHSADIWDHDQEEKRTPPSVYGSPTEEDDADDEGANGRVVPPHHSVLRIKTREVARRLSVRPKERARRGRETVRQKKSAKSKDHLPPPSSFFFDHRSPSPLASAQKHTGRSAVSSKHTEGHAPSSRHVRTRTEPPAAVPRPIKPSRSGTAPVVGKDTISSEREDAVRAKRSSLSDRIERRLFPTRPSPSPSPPGRGLKEVTESPLVRTPGKSFDLTLVTNAVKGLRVREIRKFWGGSKVAAPADRS